MLARHLIWGIDVSSFWCTYSNNLLITHNHKVNCVELYQFVFLLKKTGDFWTRHADQKGKYKGVREKENTKRERDHIAVAIQLGKKMKIEREDNGGYNSCRVIIVPVPWFVHKVFWFFWCDVYLGFSWNNNYWLAWISSFFYQWRRKTKRYMYVWKFKYNYDLFLCSVFFFHFNILFSNFLHS